MPTWTSEYPPGYTSAMHTQRHRSKLVTRVRRIRGQLEAVEKSLAAGQSCRDVVLTIAAARGAINALAAEVICDHLLEHVAAPRIPSAVRAAEANELARIIRQFAR